MMNVSPTEVITACMNLGLMVSINQRLDAEALVVVAEEFGFKIEFVSADIQEAIADEEDKGGGSGSAPADRDGDGSRRPRQDVPAGLHPQDERHRRRGRRYHAAHRSVQRGAERSEDHVPRYPGSRSLHGDACGRDGTWRSSSWRRTTTSCRRPSRPSTTPRQPEFRWSSPSTRSTSHRANPDHIKEQPRR